MPLIGQKMGDGAVGREHEFFDQAMRDIAFAAHDTGHPALIVELDDGFGQIEIDRAAARAAFVENEREIAHVAEILGEMRVTFGHFRIALQGLC